MKSICLAVEVREAIEDPKLSQTRAHIQQLKRAMGAERSVKAGVLAR